MTCPVRAGATDFMVKIMKLKSFALILLAAVCLLPFVSPAEELGDPAPPLVVKEWIQGEPVEIKAGTNIYVVVIWDTRIARGKETIDKLNELQKKYRDQGLVIVGISDEAPEQIRNFVRKPDVHFDFAVGADTARRTAMAYMLGFKLRTIPRAFVVGKDGKLLWQGPPLMGLDVMLGEAVAGKFDLERAKRTDEFRNEVESYRMLEHRGDPRARAAGESLLAGWTNNVRYLCDFAYFIVNDTKNPRRDFALADHALILAEKASPTNTLRLLTTRVAYLIEIGETDTALNMVKTAMNAATDAKEKAALEPYLKKVEARIEARKKEQQAAATNSVDATSSTTNSAPKSSVNVPGKKQVIGPPMTRPSPKNP